MPEFSAPGAPASGVTHPAPALGDPAAVGDSTNGSGGASEWHFNTDQNEMQRWLDGTELTDMHVVDRPTTAGSGCLGDATGDEWLAPPEFSTLHLGWESYQSSSNDRNLWIDDVAIATERVGCPAP